MDPTPNDHTLRRDEMPGSIDPTHGVLPPADGATALGAALPGAAHEAAPEAAAQPRQAAAAASAADRCPRCGGSFHCGVNDAQPCACTGLALDPALLRRLQARWPGCLCLPCLHALAGGAAVDPADAQSPPPAARP